MSVTMTIGNLDVTLVALQTTTVVMRDAARIGMDTAGKTYLREVKKRIGLRDHSLADLARKGHPYARRHGSPKIHTRKPWQVHSHTGRLKAATTGHSLTSTSGAPGYEVGIDTGRAPHARYVVYGTKTMLPRDPLWQTAIDPTTNKRIMAAMTKKFGKAMRSKIGLRFKVK